MTETEEFQSEQWEVTALKKLAKLQMLILDGYFTDQVHFASEIIASAEIIAGIPTVWEMHITDGGCFTEELL